MFRIAIALTISAITLCHALEIIDAPIDFGAQRHELTKAYIENRYGFTVEDTSITPVIIVVHYTGSDSFQESFARLQGEVLPQDRSSIAAASPLNVSAHFLVGRDGTPYRLMDETTMARHVIGLNYSSIGIENVGGEDHCENLTDEQLQTNVALITSLVQKYPTISFLIGHDEYRCFEETPLWLEQNDDYRTFKRDPGKTFMTKLREYLPQLNPAPCEAYHD